MSFLNYFWSDPRLEHVSSAAAAGFINASGLTSRFLRVEASPELRAWAAAVSDAAHADDESKPTSVPAEFAGELLALPTLTFLPGVVEWAIGSQSLEFVKWLHEVRPSLFYSILLSEYDYDGNSSEYPDVRVLAFQYERLDVLQWWIPLICGFEGYGFHYGELVDQVVRTDSDFARSVLSWLADYDFEFSSAHLANALLSENWRTAELLEQIVPARKLHLSALFDPRDASKMVRILEWLFARSLLETDGIFVEASSTSLAVLEWVYENREQLELKAGEHGQAYMHARTPARRNWLYDRKEFVGVSIRVPPHTSASVREWLRARPDLVLTYE
jgi:hypothetical protein